jgi:branched-chain amino acid transport system ATP-binding protein
LLDVRSLQVSFGKIDVLRDVDLSVGTNEIVAILGPNGSGKSTTLRAVMGLVKSRGQVILAGRDLSRLSTEARVRAGISLVPQSNNLMRAMTVEENLRLGAFLRHRADTVAEDIDDWLAFVPGLGDLRRRRGGALSGGERQLAAIACGLMSRPSLLLLDEPSLGVAPRVLNVLRQILLRLRDERGLTLVLVEQDVPFALEVADRVVVLVGGSVALTEEPAALRDGRLLHEVYFGTPPGERATPR